MLNYDFSPYWENALPLKSQYFSQIEINEKRVYSILKRLLDIVFSSLAIIALIPLFIIVAIAIKIDSKGPVIYSQIRCGKNNKKFKMYKFRSMVKNADEYRELLLDQNEVQGPCFKIRNDPRTTRVGKFLRKTSIDELPQLFNVLRGDMTIVGPRPPLPEEVERYSPYQMQRLLVKPGLTCYWQVMGRSDIPFNEWIELDLKYIRERSMLLDLKLILQTIPVLINAKGAY